MSVVLKLKTKDQRLKTKDSRSKKRRRNLYFPLMEVKMRNAIADRFLFDGNLKIAEGDDADLVLKRVLKNYDRGALRYEENSDVQEYRVQIFVSLELWDVEKQEIVWQEPNFVGESTYFVTGSLAKSESV